jgi:hypothetical protein
MTRKSPKSARGKAENYLLSSDIAGDMGPEQAAAALRSMLLGSMALGNLYLQRLVLDPPSGGGKGGSAADIPAGFHKLSQSIAAMARALRGLPGEPGSVAAPRPYADLSVRLAEAMERLEEAEERRREDDDDEPWDTVSELERQIFARAGIGVEDDKQN